MALRELQHSELVLEYRHSDIEPQRYIITNDWKYTVHCWQFVTVTPGLRPPLPDSKPSIDTGQAAERTWMWSANCSRPILLPRNR